MKRGIYDALWLPPKPNSMITFGRSVCDNEWSYLKNLTMTIIENLGRYGIVICDDFHTMLSAFI